MGASKRLAEIYVQSLSIAISKGLHPGKTRFITTRFGNVLGSNGSVIPRFREQLAKGGPLTVTHPDIIRYFMTIPEACRLVLEAAFMGKGNEIFVFDMGTAGAAWATWLSQATVCAIFVYQLKWRSRLLGGFSFFVRLKKNYSQRILQLGLPVAMLNTLFAIINIFMARTASTYGGHIGLMTLTAGGQIEAIAWNTSQGFSTALSAFVAQNYAASEKNRVLEAYHTTLKMTTVFGILCTLLFVFYGSEVFSLIVPQKEAFEAGGIFLRIDGYSMLFMMLEITMQGLFYGTGRTVPPAIISITFNSLRIPMAIVLSAMGLGIVGVWWAISISSMLKGIVSFIWFRALQKKILK
jgi:Na+-driven multidrug efflux pump